jgi:hypothetical protein
MKKISFLALILLFSMIISSCGLINPQGSDPTTTEPPYEGEYEIRLTAIGSTTIKAGKTVQIRSSVTGTTSKDVIFTSSNPEIATVSEKGLVTGISAGTATITCELVIEPACKKTITITVEAAIKPESIEIENADNPIAWAGETLQLSTKIVPEEASALVTWESSDEDVATVSENGLVSFLKAGDVTITATSVEDTSVSASVTFRVKVGFFRSDMGSPYWNLSEQSADENPKVTLEIDNSKLGYHSCYLANVSATRYYVEGVFDVPANLISTWVWQGFGFGSGLSETSTRYFIFSPRVEGQGNDFNKFIVKDLPNETWPAITTRSQTWGENGLDYIDWKNQPVKIGMMRDENTYYYFINDKLMYVDETMLYDGIPTMPILVAIDIPVTVTEYKLITDDAELDAMLEENRFQSKFFSSNEDIIEILSNDSFVFKSNNVLNKLNRVKSLGDAAKLVGDFTIEFDVADLLCNSAHSNIFTGMTLNLSRYDSADTIESFSIGKSAEQPDAAGLVARYGSWNYVQEMSAPTSHYFWSESSAVVAENPLDTHHIKLTRTIENNIATFRLWVDGEEVTFDVLSSKYNTMTCKYTGAYVLWIGGEYASGSITNLVIQSNQGK